MRTHSNITGPTQQISAALAMIRQLAASEPATMDEANERLYAIEDAAAQAFLDRQA
jgi:hypothetical protein